MGDNQLQDTLPTELGNMLQLEQLRLQNNQLRGQVPTELGALENLRELQLHGNLLLEGAVPAQLCDGTNNFLLSTLTADCSNVTCGCCTVCY